MAKAKKLILLCLIAFILMPLALVAEEDEGDPNLPGDPECRSCQGTGKITYGKKSGDIRLIKYCYNKARGKRCPVLIGGWEPCMACEDWPDMQPIFAEHEQIVKNLKREGDGLVNIVLSKKSPIRKLNFTIGEHSRIFTDCPHSKIHGYQIWVEKNYIQFSKDFKMGEEGSDWDNRWKSRKPNFICLKSNDMFMKCKEWGYKTKNLSPGTIRMGLKSILGLGGVWFLIGTMQAAAPDGPDHDERGFIHTLSQSMLRAGFNTAGERKDPFRAWLTQGIGSYYQEKLRNSVTWYSVAYGAGKKRDDEIWFRYSTWKKALAQANSVTKAKVDERTGKWKGLIPLDILITLRITNMPHQGIVQSWSLVNYLMGDLQKSKRKRAEKKAQFKELIKRIGSGMDQVEAFKTVYKIKKLSSLETKYRMWLRKFAR